VGDVSLVLILKCARKICHRITCGFKCVYAILRLGDKNDMLDVVLVPRRPDVALAHCEDKVLLLMN